MQTSVSGIFACGNVLHVHDLVDFVSQEAACAGKAAAKYIAGGLQEDKGIEVTGTQGVRYTVPGFIHPVNMEEEIILRFRVGNVYQNNYISMYFDEERILHRKKKIMVPGEMEELKLKKSDLDRFPALQCITVKIEEA